MTAIPDDIASLDPEERLAKAELALDELRRERNALWAQLQERKAQDRHVAHLERTISELQSSASWRITSPLRTVKRLGGPVATLRAVRHRLRRA